MANDASMLGSKLGPRLADLMAQAAISTRAGFQPMEHELRVQASKTVVDWMGSEFGAVMTPLVEPLLRTKDIPPEIKNVLRNMTSGKNQWQALAGIAFGGSGVMSALGTIMNNYLAPTVRATVGANPMLIPDPATIAQLMARNIIGNGAFYEGMNGQGISTSWAEAMMEGTRPTPDLGSLIQLVRMGVITETDAEFQLVRAGYPQETALWLLRTSVVPLSVADAALAVLRGNIDQGTAEHVAHLNGVTSEDLKIMVDNTGEPPALEALLQLWRRGAIGDPELEKGIRQSRVRDEWITTIKQLGIQPPSPAEIINSLVTGQTSQGEAERRWKEAGGDPSWFLTAYHTGGEAPTPNELAVLANRGIIPWTGTGSDRVTYEQGFAESRFKNKYLPYYRKLAEYLPPPRTITALLNSGAIDKPTAIRMFQEAGLTPELSAIYADDSHHTKTAKQRDLAVGELETLYENSVMSRTDTAAALVALGYDSDDAEFILDIVDLRRVRKYNEALIAAIHSRFVHRVIDESTASSDMDKAGISAPERNQLLILWEMERGVEVKLLTVAEIRSAVKKNLMPLADAVKRLEDMGYQVDDVAILLQL